MGCQLVLGISCCARCMEPFRFGGEGCSQAVFEELWYRACSSGGLRVVPQARLNRLIVCGCVRLAGWCWQALAWYVCLMLFAAAVSATVVTLSVPLRKGWGMWCGPKSCPELPARICGRVLLGFWLLGAVFHINMGLRWWCQRHGLPFLGAISQVLMHCTAE